MARRPTGRSCVRDGADRRHDRLLCCVGEATRRVREPLMVESRVTRCRPPTRRRRDARVHLLPARRDRDLRVQREHLADLADRALHDEVVQRRLARRGRVREALWTSVKAALGATAIALVLGTLRVDRRVALPLLRQGDDLVPRHPPDRAARDHHGARAAGDDPQRPHSARDQLQHLDDHHRPRDVLHRRRLQQRGRAHAPDYRARSRRRRWILAPTRGRPSAT